VSTNGGNGGSAVWRSLARRTVRRLYRQAPRRLSVFLHTKARARQYKRGVGSDAAATCMGAGRYDGAATGRAARCKHAASARREGRATHVSGRGPRCADRQTKAGLDVRYGVVRRRAIAIGRDVARAARARGPASKPFGLALFKREFIQNLRLKCTKG
jgi:hypothetical protein